MKSKINVFERLHKAAAEIVATTRKAIESSGEPHPERIPLYLPVMIHGTDLRIAIESGPSIAAQNAICRAQGKAGGSPEMSFNDATRRAGDLLAVLLMKARETNTETGEEYAEQIIEVIEALNRGR